MFEKAQLKCSGPRQGQTLQLWDCASADGEVQMSWMGKSATSIRSVSGTVFGNDVQAIGVLSALARLGYDDAKPDEGAAFVAANIGSGGEVTIGSARLVLTGPSGGRSLDVIAIGAK